MRSIRRGAPFVLVALLFLLAACGDPVQPALPDLDVVVAAGDGQFGAVGQTLATPLHAVVMTRSSGKPREDVTVRWEVVSGTASFATSTADATDATGSSYATVRLGSTPGEVVVKVTVVDQESASASFTLFAVDTPVLDGLSPTTAEAGDVVTLTGANFHPDAARNVVLFSGIRGAVSSSSATALQVVVPPCLPTRTVSVSVRLGSLSSETRSLDVAGNVGATAMEAGEVMDLADPSGVGCLRLEGGTGTSYLAVAYSAGQAAVARHPGSFRGLAASHAGQGLLSAARGPVSGGQDPPAPVDVADAQLRWDRSLRGREERLVARRPSSSVASVVEGGPAGVEAVPSVGDERTFRVLNGDGGFDDVTAEARYVGDRAVLYVDATAPSGGFTTADLRAFSETFDETIHPTVTEAFGGPSDLDGNDRIVVLFTPTVNRLTARGAAGGFVAGFFYGLDLLRDDNGDPLENSNDAEIFYSIVPDPDGVHSDPRPVSQVLDVTPAVLAHEFQHMVHFNQRILVSGAAAQEALWLSEGLAQMAEELVARAFASSGDLSEAASFRSGNLIRARRYLLDPLAVSLLITTGQGSLEERGAGWLHVLYLAERFGTPLLRALTSSTLTGVANVSSETGVAWDALLADWWAALYLDGRGAHHPRLTFGSLGLRELVRRTNGTDALAPSEVGSTDFVYDLSFWSSSARHYILRPPSDGSLVIRLGGEGGGTASASSELRLRIVRLF